MYTLVVGWNESESGPLPCAHRVSSLEEEKKNRGAKLFISRTNHPPYFTSRHEKIAYSYPDKPLDESTDVIVVGALLCDKYSSKNDLPVQREICFPGIGRILILDT